MNKYITKTEFLLRYPSFSDHTDDEINTAIADAESLIEGYLGTKFTINPESVPGIIVRIASSLTYYYIMQANIQVNSEEDYSKFYNSCIDLLNKIVSGSITGIEVAESNSVVTIISTGGDYEYRC